MLSFEGVQELDSADRIRVLGIIDQFRELGVNEDVSLPQVWLNVFRTTHTADRLTASSRW